MSASNACARLPDFWSWARQVGFMTSDAHASFAALKDQWRGENPDASDADREAADKRLANLLNVDAC